MILSAQRQVRMEIDHTLRTIRLTTKVKFLLKHFIASLTLDVVNFTPMKRTQLSAAFSDILGLLNQVL